jgi:hypothetical protein
MAVGLLFCFSTRMASIKETTCSIHVRALSGPILTSKAPISEEREVEKRRRVHVYMATAV